MIREKIEAVGRVQDYIEAHLKKNVTLNELSRVAGYSPAYTSTIFKEVTGECLFEYLRKRRLTKAALDLRDNLCPPRVIDVAFDYVFDSHEGFTKAFSKAFGITPKSYQLSPPPIQLFLPYHAKSMYEFQQKRRDSMKRESTIFVQVIEKPERKLLLKRGQRARHYFEYCEEVGCDVWGVLVSVKEALGEPMGLWLPRQMILPGTSEYVQGVELPLDDRGVVPDGFDILSLPACKMMIFQGEPYEDEHFGDAIDALWQAIDRYDPKLYGFSWAPDDGPRFQLEPQGYRGYIEGRPVKQI